MPDTIPWSSLTRPIERAAAITFILILQLLVGPHAEPDTRLQRPQQSGYCVTPITLFVRAGEHQDVALPVRPRPPEARRDTGHLAPSSAT